MITPAMLQGLNAGLGALNAYNNAKLAKTQGEVNRIYGEIEADALLERARERTNQGVRQAREERHKGKIIESDAIAQMAASGGGLDPVMLARIKQRADHNTMSAIYDAQMDAGSYRLQAVMARAGARNQQIEGNRRYRNYMVDALTTGLSAWPRGGSTKSYLRNDYTVHGPNAGR